MLTLFNIIRYAVLAELAFTFILTLFILYYYGRRQTYDRRWNNALTWHVVTMLVVFTGLSVYCFADLLARVNQPITWRSPVLLIIFGLAVAGESAMLKYQMELDKKLDERLATEKAEKRKTP